MQSLAPDLSLLVPCYNAGRLLEQALASALDNDRASIEVLVLNDGSTDGSEVLMERFAAQDSRLRVITKANEGYGATINRGMREAKGRYIAILEPDDYLKPHMFDELIELARSYSEPDIVKSAYWRVIDALSSNEQIMACAYQGRIKPGHQPFVLKDAPRLVQHHPSIWSAIYRRDFLLHNNIWMHELPGAGWVDNPFLFETMLKAKSIVYTDKAYYCYRESFAGSSSAGKTAHLAIARWLDEYEICHNLKVTDPGILTALHAVALRYIGGALHEGALNDPELAAGLRHMCSLLDPQFVAQVNHVSPKMRVYVLSLGNKPAPKMSFAAHLVALVSEFVHSLKINGLGFALSRIGLFFKRKAGGQI